MVPPRSVVPSASSSDPLFTAQESAISTPASCSTVVPRTPQAKRSFLSLSTPTNERQLGAAFAASRRAFETHARRTTPQGGFSYF